MDKTPIYLFSVDLEDIRLSIPNGVARHAERVPTLTRRYLDFLEQDLNGSRATFFTVGEVARMYPSLIREIAERGHEVALHSHRHIALTELGPDGFKTDLDQSIQALESAGIREMKGFRAPTFSLTEKTAWAFEILEKRGFTYSSSVLPAKNPLFGWAEFGPSARRVGGILELPMSVEKFGPLTLPFAGGVYFRTLPEFLIRRAFRARARAGEPALGYFHPYDIDTDQERFMHPGIHESRFYNWLMYYNRKEVFPRLSRLVRDFGLRIMTYREYVKTLEAGA